MLTKAIEELTWEYEAGQTGYELAIKACLYRIIVRLLREHVDLSPLVRLLQNEASMERVARVLKHIESNYTEKLTINELSRITGVSRYTFAIYSKRSQAKRLVIT